MTKKVLKTRVREVKQEVDGKEVLIAAESGRSMMLTNNQRCAFIVPLQLLGKTTYVDECILRPMQSIKVDKGLFEFQVKYNRPFEYLVAKGLIIAKQVKIDPRDLKHVEPVKAPPELTGERQAGIEKMDILQQAVTLDVNLSPNK